MGIVVGHSYRFMAYDRPEIGFFHISTHHGVVVVTEAMEIDVPTLSLFLFDAYGIQCFIVAVPDVGRCYWRILCLGAPEYQSIAPWILLGMLQEGRGKGFGNRSISYLPSLCGLESSLLCYGFLYSDYCDIAFRGSVDILLSESQYLTLSHSA